MGICAHIQIMPTIITVQLALATKVKSEEIKKYENKHTFIIVVRQTHSAYVLFE